MLGPDCGARGSRWLHSPHQNVIVPRGTAWPVRCRVVACAEVEAELRNEPTANEGACDFHEEVVERSRTRCPACRPVARPRCCPDRRLAEATPSAEPR